MFVWFLQEFCLNKRKNTFDHGGNFSTTEFNKGLDIKIIGWKKQLEKFLLIGKIDKIFIPRINQIFKTILG